jgi:hypothetical protein
MCGEVSLDLRLPWDWSIARRLQERIRAELAREAHEKQGGRRHADVARFEAALNGAPWSPHAELPGAGATRGQPFEYKPGEPLVWTARLSPTGDSMQMLERYPRQRRS